MTRTRSSSAAILVALVTGIMPLHGAAAQDVSPKTHEPARGAQGSASLRDAAAEAQIKLRQSFTNLQFEDFGPAPVEGPIYQASAGGKIVYYAPQSEHLLFATVYDRNGINLTALAQEQGATRRLKAIDPAKALAIGPADAPTVIEFTDPDCPYCQALDRFWSAKAAEGKPVRRLIFFVSGIHPTAAAKAEHILCSPDREAAFRAAYSGQTPPALRQCAAGRDKVAQDAELVAKVGVSGTPTLIADGKLISGFQQAELEAFLDRHAKPALAKAASDAQR
ncbi:DsbC family protein [Sphingobium sp. H39-3-25]|nr:DsbC family protein [Sphingobium arseniciresistens]